jgi:hypothetical protein
LEVVVESSGPLAVLVFALIIAVPGWALYKSSGGRLWSSQWLAFSFTLGAALFLGAGAIGYRLGRQARFFEAGPDWREIAVGLLMGGVALGLWWRAHLKRASSN